MKISYNGRRWCRPTRAGPNTSKRLLSRKQVASIRLFILSSFDALGPMHGHRLRVEAERNHVTLWTDVSVGAVYGAMKRLASEGLLQEAGREREGRRPTRQLYEITDAGRGALATLRREGLSEVWFRFDPFDLALTRMDAAVRDDLPDLLARRLDAVREIAGRATAAERASLPARRPRQAVGAAALGIPPGGGGGLPERPAGADRKRGRPTSPAGGRASRRPAGTNEASQKSLPPRRRGSGRIRRSAAFHPRSQFATRRLIDVLEQARLARLPANPLPRPPPRARQT